MLSSSGFGRHSVTLWFSASIFSPGRQHVGTHAVGLFLRILYGLLPIFTVDVDTNQNWSLEIKTVHFRVKGAVWELADWIANPTVEHEFLDCQESLD